MVVSGEVVVVVSVVSVLADEQPVANSANALSEISKRLIFSLCPFVF
jgi:hypothetical protein